MLDSENKILTRDGVIELIENKYIQFIVHDHIKKIDKDRLLEVNNAFRLLCDGNKYPLIMISNSIDRIDKEEEEIIREHTPIFFNSQALVTSNRFTVMVLNFALTFKKTDVPTKLFSNKEDGLNWLTQFIQK